MKTQIKTLVVLTGLILLMVYSVNAQRGQGDLTGIGMELEKPQLVLISGKLDHIKTGPCENTTGHAYIGTHLFLQTGNGDALYNIHLGATYALESYVDKLSIGQNVEVLGFRTEQMEDGHYIAKEITTNGHTFVFRDEELRPFWAGDRRTVNRSRFDRRRGRW
jgi:hypothetical protein